MGALALASGAPAQEPPDPATVAESVAVRTATIRGAQVSRFDEPDEFAPGRYLVLLVRTMPAGRIPPALLACGVSGADRAVRAACVPLPAPGASATDVTFELTSFEVADIDQDGADEATIEISYSGAGAGPDGGTEFRRLAVLRLIPRPTVAFSLETWRSDMASDRFTARRVTFTDLDGDGHADALVSQWTCSEAPSADTTANAANCWHSTARHRWMRTTRRWGPAIALGR